MIIRFYDKNDGTVIPMIMSQTVHPTRQERDSPVFKEVSCHVVRVRQLGLGTDSDPLQSAKEKKMETSL